MASRSAHGEEAAPLSNPAGQSAPLDPASKEGRARLTALIAEGLMAHVEIIGVEALSGGASSATYALSASVDGGPRQFIFQRAASSGFGLSRRIQAEVMRRAGRLGVPVPPVIAIPSDDDGLGDAVITGFMPGEALAPRWLRLDPFTTARERLVTQCAEALARLHAAPLSTWADLPLGSGSGAELLESSFATYRRLGVDVPAFDLAFAWLKPRMPTDPPTSLVHGDFRSGNFLVSEEGLSAVLDWELPHLSSPAEDLGWLCAQAWRFGRWQWPVGGFATREALLDAYRDAGGKISAEELHVWEVYGNLKWGMSCLMLADDHVSGRVPSVERAAIGRRVSEVAADLVYILAFRDL